MYALASFLCPVAFSMHACSIFGCTWAGVTTRRPQTGSNFRSEEGPRMYIHSVSHHLDSLLVICRSLQKCLPSQPYACAGAREYTEMGRKSSSNLTLVLFEPQRRHVGHSNRWLGDRGASAATIWLRFQWSSVRNGCHGRQALRILPLSVPQGYDWQISRWS